MSPAVRLIASQPALRMLAVGLALTGVVSGAVYPYQSLIAIRRIGLSDATFAAMLVLASAVAVIAAVGIGLVTDQRTNRRQTALVTAVLGLAGALLMVVLPGRISFLLYHALLLPIAFSLFGQMLALARLACFAHPDHRDGVLTTLRAALSLSFVGTLLMLAAASGMGVDVLFVYGISALAGGALVVLIWSDWPLDGQTPWADPGSGMGIRMALRSLAQPDLMLRLICLGAITSGGALYLALLSLLFAAAPGRGAGDSALFIGLVAAVEVPFMLMLPMVAGRYSKTVLIVSGGAIYAVYLLLLPLLATSPAVWLLPVLAGLGGAAILTQPVAYLQDMMTNRPGTASALLALQKLIADSAAALVFAVGTAVSGYTLVATLGAGVMLIGCAVLAFADRRR